jgi:hypothetical protein
MLAEGSMDTFKVYYEEFKVRGLDLVEKVRTLVHESNVRRIIIKDDSGNTFMEIPLSVATISAMLMPLLAALGAIAALVADFTIVLERVEKTAPAATAAPPEAPAPPAEPAAAAPGEAPAAAPSEPRETPAA